MFSYYNINLNVRNLFAYFFFNKFKLYYNVFYHLDINIIFKIKIKKNKKKLF